MKHIGQLFLGLLFLFCYNAFANPLIPPKDTESGVKEVTEYLNKNNEDILKVYHKDGTWGNFKDEGKGTGNVYVISHGVNDVHDAEWVKKTAEAILNKDSNAQILSVNWDEYSNARTNTTTNEDNTISHSSGMLNPMASTWINSVAQLVSEELSSQNVTNVSAAIGHSYGAHVLAGVVKDMPDNTVDKLIALDPAEESLTFTGGQNGETTTMWSSEKQSKDWGIDGLTTTEVYKSSSFLGNDIPLGDYNYIIANTGTFSPKSLIGDWGGFNVLAGKGSKHSLATQWVIDQISNSDSIGGWFNDDVSLDAGKGTWHGIVNTDTRKLDYAVKGSTDSWGEAVFEFAYTADDWSNTVLNQECLEKFKEMYPPRQDIIDQLNQFLGDDSSQVDISSLISSLGGTTTGENATTMGGNGTTTGNDENKSVGETLLDAVTDMVKEKGDEILNDAKGTVKDALENIWDDIKDDFSVENAIDSIIENAKSATSEIINNAITKATEFIKDLVSWKTLEELAVKGIDALLNKNPQISKVLGWFGLNNGQSIINLGKELFNGIKDWLGGKSLLEVLQNSPCLINALKNGIKTGINALINKFLTPLVNKAITKISAWLDKVLGGIFGKLGISVSQEDIVKLLSKLYGEGIKLLDKEVDKYLNKAVTIILAPGKDSSSTNSTDTEKQKQNKPSDLQIKKDTAPPETR